MDKSLLVIISSPPYKGSDVVWNALRLAGAALDKGLKTRIFLINEGVDTGRVGVKPQANFFDLCEMLVDLAERGAEVKFCKTCIDRCGVGVGEMADKIHAGSMNDLYNWTMESDKAVTF